MSLGKSAVKKPDPFITSQRRTEGRTDAVTQMTILEEQKPPWRNDNGMEQRSNRGGRNQDKINGR